jgi:hypothetical protein
MGDYTKSAVARLGERGRELWDGVHRQMPAITGAEEAILLEACRALGTLDRLHVQCQSDDLDRALAAMTETRQTVKNLMSLLAALRVPDRETGRRPGRRPPRGVYRPRAASRG